jgi:hypothetical protein
MRNIYRFRDSARYNVTSQTADYCTVTDEQIELLLVTTCPISPPIHINVGRRRAVETGELHSVD